MALEPNVWLIGDVVSLVLRLCKILKCGDETKHSLTRDYTASKALEGIQAYEVRRDQLDTSVISYLKNLSVFFSYFLFVHCL